MARKFRAIPSRIDHAMTERKLSAEAIARAAGLADGSYIRRMRRGEKRALSATLQTAEAVANMTGLPMDYLFTEIDPRTGRDLVMPMCSKTPGAEEPAA